MMTRSVMYLIALLLMVAVPASAQQARAVGPDTLNSNNDEVILDVTGMGTAAVSVTGTFTATIEFAVSVDSSGSSFFPVNCRPPNSATEVETTTSAGLWVCPVAGPRRFRARMTPYTSGSASVVISASTGGGGIGSSGGGGGGTGDGAIQDGANASVEASVFDLTGSNALATQIVDGDGNAITSFGGGTQYTEGDTDATIVGTTLLWEDAGDTLRPVSATTRLPVALGASTNNIGDVDILTIAAGDNNIGNMDVASIAAGDNNIGNVDVVTLPGQYAEDTVAANGDFLFMSGCMRSDSGGTLVDTDGDRSLFSCDGDGNLRTRAIVTIQESLVPLTVQLENPSAVADEDGEVPDDQPDTATVIAMPYVHNGDNWVIGYGNYSTGWSTAAVLAAQVKGAAGYVFGLDCYNTDDTPKFVRLYNQTGAPANTDTANIVWRGLIPQGGSGSGLRVLYPGGKEFPTGVGIRVTGAAADNDTTVLATNDAVCNLDVR